MDNGTYYKNRPFSKALLALLALLSVGSCMPVDLITRFHGDIAFVSDRSGTPFGPLYIMDDEGRAWKPLANTRPSSPEGLAWSPDGTILAFEAVLLDEDEYHGLEGIVFVKIGSNQNERTTFGACRYSPAWSPDGQFLAFYTDCDDKSNLSVSTPEGVGEVDLVTNLPDRVIDGTHYPMRISWSPDSEFLVYDVRNEQGEWEIWTVSADGEANGFVTDGREPAWSPTRSEIAFERGEDLWIRSMETGEEHKLIDDPVRAEWPAWSPSGDQLLFVSWRDDSEKNRRTSIANTEIYRISRDGSGLVNLTQNAALDAYPAWRPRDSE